MRKLIVLLVAAAFLVAMGLPAMAADKSVTFYGNVRMTTAIADFDKEAAPGGKFSDKDLDWALDDGNTRFGAKFAAGDIAGNVEIRPRDGGYVRHWYGSWNFGAGKLIIGQTWTPTFMPVTGQAMYGGLLASYGDTIGSLRQPGLQVHFPIKAVNGTLKVAALTPHDPGIPEAGGIFVASGEDTDTSIPKMEGSLSFGFGPLSGAVALGYNTYSEVNTATDKEYDIDSWIGMFKLAYSGGPFYVKGHVYKGQNLKQSGYITGSVLTPENLVGDTLEDVDELGFAACAGFKFSDKLGFEAGYTQVKEDMDRPAGTVSDEDKRKAFYLQAPITLAKGVKITPEYVVLDNDHKIVNGTRTELGKQTYYGIYWFIAF
ncbi:MAG: porin [Deltaproteobacteria bacterium]|nr:porin [Deltaproteobacteria bacterium]MBW2298816.1 porin [Deltaproteobacteria bacterium]